MRDLVFLGERDHHGTAAVYFHLEGQDARDYRRRLALPRLRTRGFDREARHSPTGFEWGYGGSGPAELARALLMKTFPGDDRVRHPRCYQRFKADVVAGLAQDRWRLTAADIRRWHARSLRELPGYAREAVRPA